MKNIFLENFESKQNFLRYLHMLYLVRYKFYSPPRFLNTGGKLMNKEKGFRTDFLFATTGFLMGAGSVFNIAGNYYEFASSSSGEIADYKALESDWQMIGVDFNNALNKFDKEKLNELV